ncbi:MAG: High-affinity branched-chain amino acid transport system permease protein LivH, partial [uncultured Acidimicrobiales bacterium]
GDHHRPSGHRARARARAGPPGGPSVPALPARLARTGGARPGAGLAGLRVPALPGGLRGAAVHDRRHLRDHRALPQRAPRLRRPDLPRPPGLRRHRRLHLGLHGLGPEPAVLGGGRRGGRGRRPPGPRPRRRLAAHHRALLRPRHALLRARRRAEHLPGRGAHRGRAGPGGAEAGRVRDGLAVLLPVPRLPRPRAVGRLAPDAQQGGAGAARPAGEPPGGGHLRGQRAHADAVRLRRLRGLRRAGRRPPRPQRHLRVTRGVELQPGARLRHHDGGRRPAEPGRRRHRLGLLRPPAVPHRPDRLHRGRGGGDPCAPGADRRAGAPGPRPVAPDPDPRAGTRGDRPADPSHPALARGAPLRPPRPRSEGGEGRRCPCL